MAAPIRIRAYSVGFGDCVLVRIPDGAKVRHLLVDFGRAPGQGSASERFKRIAEDIASFCGGRLDVLVMTHEHLDHLEGFLQQRKVFDRLKIDHVWLGLPSEPAYYSRFPRAQKQKKLADVAADLLASAPRNELAPELRAVLENNVSNDDRMKYLRELAKTGAKVDYLARGEEPKGFSPFTSAKVQVLGPEKDLSVYYSNGRARDFAAAAGLDAGRGARGDDWWAFPGVKTIDQPANLSSSDWTRLREAIRGGGMETARFIDRAANNTSLCFVLTVAGKRLLFSGDAEHESWAKMREHAASAMTPVDFLKVSHHGSFNGTPDEVLELLLPKSRSKQAVALVSTQSGAYGKQHPVPDARVLEQLSQRCREVHSTDGLEALHVEFEV